VEGNAGPVSLVGLTGGSALPLPLLLWELCSALLQCSIRVIDWRTSLEHDVAHRAVLARFDSVLTMCHMCAQVRREMVEDKDLPEASADRIGEFVGLCGAPADMLAQLRALPALSEHEAASAALAEMGTLFDLLDAMGGLANVSFDLSLARGLDYYTGVIYEAVLKSGKSDGAGNEITVGSVAAGGRCARAIAWNALRHWQVQRPAVFVQPASSTRHGDCLRSSATKSGAVAQGRRP
jgi:Histidyl-tRNA synthetase